jgi:hypothetical protein
VRGDGIVSRGDEIPVEDVDVDDVWRWNLACGSPDKGPEDIEEPVWGV